MTINFQFALIDSDDAYRYPFKKTELKTGRYGFALGNDKNGKGEYTDSIEDVVKQVVVEGNSVRVRTRNLGHGKDGNILFLNSKTKKIKGYWIAPELKYLVEHSLTKPITDEAESPQSALSKHIDASAWPFPSLKALSVDDYVDACSILFESITPDQREMLVGHAAAPRQTITMSEVTRLGNYPNQSTADFEYAKLLCKFSNYFDIEVTEDQKEVLAIKGPADSEGQSLWTLRPALTKALNRLGLDEILVTVFGVVDAADEVDADPQSQGISSTTRVALINARIGQGKYRTQLLSMWDSTCAVTGCAIETVLIASHAKAWAAPSNQERLDPYNGFLLAASIDRLFDSGLISFSDEGILLLSSSVKMQALQALGLSAESHLREIQSEHKPYLKAHREKHGFLI